MKALDRGANGSLATVTGITTDGTFGSIAGGPSIRWLGSSRPQRRLVPAPPRSSIVSRHATSRLDTARSVRSSTSTRVGSPPQRKGRR